MKNEISLNEVVKLCADKISDQSINNYSNEPFQHVMIDNFFPENLIQYADKNFPPENDPSWEWSNDQDIEIKGRSSWQSEFDIPDGISEIVRILNSAPILKSISEVFSIPKLLPDPYYSGGGLNITQPGGLLDVHVDGNYHDASGLNRRINCLVYLNKNWKDNWEGHLGLYDKTGDTLIKKIAPLFNRFVIFETHDYSFHGSPNPLLSPIGHPRKSIILYYYTVDKRPSDQILVDAPHSALWKKRNILDKRGNKTRKFS